jgi:hypothetical protein
MNIVKIQMLPKTNRNAALILINVREEKHAKVPYVSVEPIYLIKNGLADLNGDMVMKNIESEQFKHFFFFLSHLFLLGKIEQDFYTGIMVKHEKVK